MSKKYLLVFALMISVAGCKDMGFRKIEGANEKAIVMSAQETLQQIELALSKYKEINHSYPRATEATLYDTLKNYFIIPIDPNHVYKSDKDQSNFIAIGARKNKIIYRYPATLGSGEYTLYWVGPNGIDEEGRGDDIFSSRGRMPKQLSRKLLANFRSDSIKTEFSLAATGSNETKDSVKFLVKSGNQVLYSDWWQLASYTAGRPELSDAERQEQVNMEFDRFFHPVHFIQADSVANNSTIFKEIDRSTLRELAKKSLPVFSYYAGNKGTKAIYWNPKERKINILQLVK